jgi:hypothetical protein
LIGPETIDPETLCPEAIDPETIDPEVREFIALIREKRQAKP